MQVVSKMISGPQMGIEPATFRWMERRSYDWATKIKIARHPSPRSLMVRASRQLSLTGSFILIRRPLWGYPTDAQDVT